MGTLIDTPSGQMKVIPGDFIKLIHKMGCFFTENTILLQSDYIACTIVRVQIYLEFQIQYDYIKKDTIIKEI